MIIAMAMFVTIAGAILLIQMAAQDAFIQGSAESDVESKGTIMLDELSDKLVDCKIITAPITANDYTLLRIQVPVISGTAYWDSDGNIYWGANNVVGLRLKYYFNTKEFLVESVPLPYTSMDINRDGDLLDSFRYGSILEVVEDSGGVTQTYRTLCPCVIINDSPAYGDINGDGVNDPLFQFLDSNGNAVSVGGNRIKINAWIGKLGIRDFPTVANAKREIALLNPQ